MMLVQPSGMADAVPLHRLGTSSPASSIHLRLFSTPSMCFPNEPACVSRTLPTVFLGYKTSALWNDCSMICGDLQQGCDGLLSCFGGVPYSVHTYPSVLLKKTLWRRQWSWRLVFSLVPVHVADSSRLNLPTIMVRSSDHFAATDETMHLGEKLKAKYNYTHVYLSIKHLPAPHTEYH